ncbi:hypothetical protein C8Q78DRAFT_961051 [Trametes maxima]|nr:hypothetical protein C8Q78DRAFT_961051 [Trametes maxima]
MFASSSRHAKDLVQPAVQANKEHQYALKVYTERLEAELEHLDKLLAAAEVSENDEEDSTNNSGNVIIPGASRPRGLLPQSVLVNETSPFYHQALKKQRYEEFTVVHPMKSQELEALADAVRSENYRIYALQAQAQGLQAFTGLPDPPQGFINTNKHGIDWERVAQKVSSAGPSVQRTAKECEIRWLGERHPQLNDSQWTQAEIAKVRELVEGAREGEVDWVDIAHKLGTGRTPVDCMRHAIVRKTHSWTPDADQRLLAAIDIYGTDNWALVARWVSEDVTASQCQNRYLRTLDPALKRGPWTADEDDRLRQTVAAVGHTWVDVAQFVQGRNNEQCRDRYQDYLSPSVKKGKWTPEQDAALMEAVEQVGLGKWKEVSQIINLGRTDNMCRIRYGLLAKRKMPGTAPSPTPEDSRAASRESSQVQTGPTEFLILHPESYVSASTSAASSSTPKPKPKPRPRKKTTAAADDIAGSSRLESQESLPQLSATVTNTTTSGPDAVQDELFDTGDKRPGSELHASESQPAKRRRTNPDDTMSNATVRGSSTSDPVAAAPLSTDEATGEAATSNASETLPEDHNALPVPGSSTPDTGDRALDDNADISIAVPSSATRGKGRGRGRGRPRGSSRARGRLPTPPQPGGLTIASPVSAPIRRQPPRAANRSSRPISAPDRSVDP